MTPRQIAIQNGDKFYEGRPCKREGHTRRRTKDSTCLVCKKIIDAKAYQKNKEKGANLYNQIDVQLKLNRRTLKNFNRVGKTIVRKEELDKEGFDPNYFTHYWKAGNGNIYLDR